MEFITHNQTTIETAGTFLTGEINAAYNKLKQVFGKPVDGDGEKTDAEWSIQFEDNTVATIYNYKSGKAYQGAHGTPKTKITEWHVGGKNTIVVERIKEILGIQ